MAKFSPILTNFTAGEISKRLFGRVDFAKYNNGCELLENFIIMTQGGATKRPGTYFVLAAKNANKKARLIPFIFSTVQAYVIEAGDLYFRFFMDHGRIESPPGTPIEVATPYTEAQLFALKVAQSADVMYIAHPSHAPRKLSRTSHTSWTLTAMDFRDGPYMDENITATTLTPSAVSGAGINITASAITGINNDTGFQATDVGRLIRIKHGATWGYAKITARTSTTVVVADVKSAFGAATAQTTWMLGAWSDTTGWPQTVTFHEDRLVWGGNTSFPQTVWFSKTSDYENYAPTKTDGTIAADNGMAYDLLADQVNSIRWLSSGDVLAIGTGGGEFVMSGGSKSEAITPTSVQAKRYVTRGSQNIKAIRIDTAVLYLQRAGKKFRELAYDFNRDSWLSIDQTVLADHVLKTGVQDLDFQQEPHSIVWFALTDGQLVGYTYNKEQEVSGFHRHPLGGTNAKVISTACIPTATADETWLLTERTINGATVKYVEYMKEEHDPSSPTDKDGAFYVDCGLSYDGVPITVVSGLDHLVGETVSILADGSVRPSQVVTAGGQITLAKSASKIHVGLKYTAKLKTVKIEGGGDTGTSQGKMQRTNRVSLRFLNTLGGKLGPSETNLEDIQFRSAGDPMDASPPLFTGDKTITFSGSYSREGGNVYYLNDQPYPATLLAVMPESTVYG